MTERTADVSASRRPPIRRPFSFKIALGIAATVSVSLAALGAAILDANERTLEDLARSRQHLALEDVARSVDATLRTTEDALETVGRMLASEADADATLALVTSTVSGASAIDVVGIYGAEGDRIDVVREVGAETVLPDALGEELRDVATDRGSASVLGEAGDVLVVVPIRARTQVTGYVAARASLEPVREHVATLAERHFPGIVEPILLVDDRSRIVVGRAGAPVPAPESLREGLEAARLGSHAGIVSWNGQSRLVTVARADPRPYRVVVSEPTAVVFASLGALRRTIGLSVVLGIVVSFAVAWVLGRRLARPIDALVAQADHLAQRRFDRRVTVDTGDELAVLGHALSSAAAELEASEKRIAEERAIRSDLGRYLPAEIVERVVQREQDMQLGGARREVSVLFADVVAFTPLTERLPPESTVKLLNELFSMLTEIVFRHGGTIDKFIGDSVMAIFGAPTDQPDHAARALRCAEDMLRFLDVGNAGWQTRFETRIELAIGVASGECVVGNVGSERRMEYTAIGDVVNTAARLEAIARPNQILVTKATAAAAGDAFDVIDRGERTLHGRREPVHVFEVAVA